MRVWYPNLVIILGRNGLSQKGIAEKAGISEAVFSRHYRSHKGFTLLEMEKIRKAIWSLTGIRYSLDELFRRGIEE